MRGFVMLLLRQEPLVRFIALMSMTA